MTQSSKQKVALSSVFASFLLTLLKLIVGLLTGSIGILSEAIHSFLDLGAASLTFFAVKIGDEPADIRHPYGHAKVESVSALIETGLLFLTSIWIAYEAIRRLMFPTVHVEATWYAFAVIIIAIVVDFSRSRALSKVAKQTSSQALEADALHFSSDILSSLVVLLGLIFVFFGINKADAIAALGVSIFVLRAGFKLGKRTIDVLVDAAPEGLTEKISEATKKVSGVIEIEKIRVRPVGASVFVEMTVTVSRKLPLAKANEIVEAIEKKIHTLVPETDITVHTKPLQLDSETVIEHVQIAALNRGLSVHNVVVHILSDKKYVSFDLEVGVDFTIRKSHQIASNLEGAIKSEIGEDIEINTHIEPLRSEAQGGILSSAEEKKVKMAITGIARNFKIIREVHDIQVRKTQGRIFITVHCLFPDDTKLEKVHDASSRFEYLIREELPSVQRVIVHAEPTSIDK